MRISLVHNPTAGDGQDVDDVIRLLTDAGHEVSHRSSKDNWLKLLQDPGDLVVAAGGDGTVRKVAVATADTDVPFAALPIGTANNIAKTLGLLGDARELVRSWDAPDLAPFDIGEVRAAEDSRRFVEGIGGGWVADLIARSHEIDKEFRLLGRETDRALHMLGDLLRQAQPARWQIVADGSDLSGDYVAVEVLNIRFVGPNIPLAPDADPSDGLLDVVIVTEADVPEILGYLEERLHLASGEMPELRSVRARDVRITVPAGVRLHVDDATWPDARDPYESIDLEVRTLAGAARMRGSGRQP